MASSLVEINNTTWTEVLVGEGFSHSTAAVLYSYSLDGSGAIPIKGGSQINGVDGQSLYAKSVSADVMNVSVTS